MRNFLSICGPLRYDARTASATATLDLSRYADWRIGNPAFLLMEGINQFCVRVGRHTMRTGTEVPPRILPVAIKRLEVTPMSVSTAYRIEGTGLVFGNTTRVAVTVIAMPDIPAGLDARTTDTLAATYAGLTPQVRAEVVVASLQVAEVSDAA